MLKTSREDNSIWFTWSTCSSWAPPTGKKRFLTISFKIVLSKTQAANYSHSFHQPWLYIRLTWSVFKNFLWLNTKIYEQLVQEWVDSNVPTRLRDIDFIPYQPHFKKNIRNTQISYFLSLKLFDSHFLDPFIFLKIKTKCSWDKCL